MAGTAHPTLQNVADFAGVSTATVSRCLNFPDQVTDKTRQKVEAAVQTLGYVPNFGARAMVARRTNTIGAIIPTMENAVFARGLQAFQQVLGEAGFTLLVASSTYSPEREADQIRSLVARGADALLLIGHDRSEEVYDFLAARKIPFVIAWAYDPDQPNPSVGFDNKAAMQTLAENVLALGHRRLALVTAPWQHNDRARLRQAGLKDAMSKAGLDPARLQIVETPYSIENGVVAFRQLWDQAQRPTAIFCGNDVLAAGVLTAAREIGVQVPREVSVLGFDDLELAQVVHPALSTVHVPHQEMGRRAAKALLDMVLQGVEPCSIELSADLKLRDTSAPPPRY